MYDPYRFILPEVPPFLKGYFVPPKGEGFEEGYPLQPSTEGRILKGNLNMTIRNDFTMKGIQLDALYFGLSAAKAADGATITLSGPTSWGDMYPYNVPSNYVLDVRPVIVSAIEREIAAVRQEITNMIIDYTPQPPSAAVTPATPPEVLPPGSPPM